MHKTALVIDTGSGLTKAGFVGDDSPTSIFASYDFSLSFTPTLFTEQLRDRELAMKFRRSVMLVNYMEAEAS